MIPPELGTAIAETAKTGGKVVDLVSSAGAYLAKTVGTIPEDFFGAAGGDWLNQHRRRNLAAMEAMTAQRLDTIDKARWTEPSASVVLPLLRTAADENREELQDLWAALLANAMLDGGRLVRRDFFDVMEKMEPGDAKVLNLMPRQPGDTSPESRDREWLIQECVPFGIRRDDLMISLEKLEELRCIYRQGTADYGLTAFGRGFMSACEVH